MGGANESAEITLSTPLTGTEVAAGVSYVLVWKLTLENKIIG